jgi:hypothetical protein
VAIAARICPNDVRLTLEQAIPGGMSLEDYSLMREVIAAIREGMPSADQMQPGAVFQHVLGALRNCPNTARPRDEVSSHVRLDLPFRLTARPLQRLLPLILESHNGRALAPIPKRSASP